MAKYHEYKDISSDPWLFRVMKRTGAERRKDVEKQDAHRVFENLRTLQFFRIDPAIENRTPRNLERIRKAIQFWVDKDSGE
jgi:hypothetical protein